jgi:uncharacterized membrane protein
MPAGEYTLQDVLGDGGAEIIRAAVTAAEKTTSGEIVVRLVQRIEPQGAPTRDAATQEFHELGLTNTRDRNAVLIYCSLDDRAIELLADDGVAAVIPQETWEEVVNIVRLGFRSNVPAAAIAMAVTRVGELLRALFPYREDDRNELSDNVV